MEPVQTGWEALSTASSRRCPKLFYKFAADEEGYELQITDITALWAAKFTAEEICDYARNSRASIDPSESTSQLKVLYEKLAESLRSGPNILKQDEKTECEAIFLQTILDLPRPLQPLRWEFYLESKGALDLAESILKPCLHQASLGLKKIDSLIDVIAAKDRALARLLEKIENSSIDLTLIFPGITGVRARKGQVTLKDAQKHVPGLAEFKRDHWSTLFDADSPYSDFESSGLSKLVAGNEKCPKHTPEQHQKWYRKLPKASATISQVAQASWLRSSSPVKQDSEDEFETQKKRAPGATPGRVVNIPAESDHEQERPSKRIKTTLSKPPPRLNGRSTQLLARSSSPNLPSSPPPVPHFETKPSVDSDGTETESEPDLDAIPKRKERSGALGKRMNPPPRPKVARQATKSSTLSSSPPPLRPEASIMSSSPPLQPPAHEPKNADTEDDFEAISALRSPKTPRKEDRLVSSPQKTDSATPTPSKDKKEDRTSKLPSTQTTPSRHRLGRLGSRNSNEPASTQTTPSRHRLGRLGSRLSQMQSQRSQAQEPQAEDDRMDLDIIDESKDKEEDYQSDASTASTASPPASPTPKKVRDVPTSQAASQHAKNYETDSQNAKSQIQPEPEVPETNEEKLARRREELKNLQTGRSGVAGGTSGVRKKRKF
ncbi:hypothetical protein LTR64_006574 [Lithohypha guttulata]|uniref:uncharacterized protein n=1 Tax=Lithohypha guttulata TaxID=1690604 RepID=UPI002DE0D51F|nr:hypothetical protein LTR51_004868 [Lithohypha guttulata]